MAPDGAASIGLGLDENWNFLQISFRFEWSPRVLVVGLYDSEGMLRCVGFTSEACTDYAELFGIPLARCSLQALPEPMTSSLRFKGRRVLEGRSS